MATNNGHGRPTGAAETTTDPDPGADADRGSDPDSAGAGALESDSRTETGTDGLGIEIEFETKASIKTGGETTTDGEPTRLERLRTRLVETGETIIDAVAERPLRTCRPDGCNWYRSANGPRTKTWVRYHERDENGYHGEDVEERIRLESPRITGLWTVIHQRPNGTQVIEEQDVTREQAYQTVEDMIAELDGVRKPNRTGRAANSV